MLDPVRRHALLPLGPRRLAARDMLRHGLLPGQTGPLGRRACAPNKSTLAYANAHRPAALYEDLFWPALVLLRWLHHLSHASWSESNLAALLRMNLDLREWLRAPFGQPTGPPPPEIGGQLEIPLPGLGGQMSLSHLARLFKAHGCTCELNLRTQKTAIFLLEVSGDQIILNSSEFLRHCDGRNRSCARTAC